MPAKAVKAPARGRRSRAEVQEEFETIQREVERERESPDPKAEEATRGREAEARQAVESVTVEGVVQRISALGLDISRALADVSWKPDTAATALDQMVQDYAREQRLETEIAAQRAAWEEESSRVERERREQEESLRKQRQREIEDYVYKKALERKKAQDKYDEEQRALERKNQERQEALEKGWQQREASLKEREEEFARLPQGSGDVPGAAAEGSADGSGAAAARGGSAFRTPDPLIEKGRRNPRSASRSCRSRGWRKP
jgi:colicin import membrane protein